ncbi:hypothetical protein BGZ95_007919 [Linnemannia exigua]|uniref:Amino acid transporter transmembrane domain-containing protein n=1 Tax=Linnemannia exigua TaxID=604196 RepID=A0AAD4DET5_9FUNG|nr:hypothetical protein BGZ95_007919 [Linnemannia exigua]
MSPTTTSTNTGGLQVPIATRPPPTTNNSSRMGWRQPWIARRESAATFESASTIVESNDSGSSSTEVKEDKEDLFMSGDGSSGEKRHHQYGVRGGGGQDLSLEDGSSSDESQDGTALSMRGERPEGVGTFKTIAGLVCVIGGTGTLGMPKAVAESGWFGSALIVLALFMSTYTGHILIECLYLKTNKRRESYQEIARDAYGAIGHHFAFTVVVVNLFGCAVLYVILSATLIEAMTREYAHVDTPVYYYVMACTAFVWVCLICTKSMKEIALLSVLGACATIGVVSITVGMSVKMLLQHTAATITATHKLVDWAKLPLALATISFAYGGNVVYPHVEQSMRYPRQWTRALWAALMVCFVMYISIAIAGYAAFGHETLSPILRNLPSGGLSITANSLITVHVLLAAPILLTSLSMMIEHSIAERLPNFSRGSSITQFLKRAGPRTVIMFLTGLIAGVVPYFGDVMDLLGSLTQCLLVFVMPIVFHYKLGGLEKASLWTRGWALFVLVIGMVALVLGTIDAVKHLVADFIRK